MILRESGPWNRKKARYLRHMGRMKRFLAGQDYTVFAVCLGLAAGLWAISQLSGRYERTLHLPIEFRNVPAEFSVRHPEYVHVTLRSTGWLWLANGAGHDAFVIDLAERSLGEGQALISLGNELQRTFDFAQVVDYEPRVLNPTFEPMSQRELPVRVLLERDLAPNHFVSGQVDVDPERVTVYGPPDDLAVLDEVNTRPLGVQGGDDVHAMLRLEPLGGGLVVSPDSVRVHVPVVEFTEKRVTCPIEVDGAPTEDILLYPDEVDVTVLLPVDRYDAIDASDFRVLANFSTIDVRRVSTVPLEVAAAPDGVRNVQLRRDQTDFLIYQQ